MISAASLAGYTWIITSTRSDVLFARALRGGKRGNTSNVNDARLYLLAGMIATDVEGQATVMAMMRALTTQISRTEQLTLGVPTTEEGRRKLEARLYKIHNKITYQLNHGAWLGLEPEEVERRDDQLQDLIETMLSATHLDTDDTTYAMDATGVHAWGRYKGRARLGEVDEDGDQRDHPDVEDQDQNDGQVEDEEPGDGAAPGADDDVPAKRKRRRTPTGSYDPEARPGYKTSKKGKSERFFGYHVHAVSSVCRTIHGVRQSPLAVQTFTVTPANADVVAPSLALLDRLAAAGITVTELGVDRHYSYKAWDRWRLQLRLRGIKPIHDLRRDDHGFTHYNGLKIAAGWPHCPATPEDLAEIPRPGFAATAEEWKQFEERIEQRRAYALRRINDYDHNGRTRWQCPALAGSCGCTLRPDTVTAAQAATRAAADRGEPVLIPIITNGADHQPADDMWKPCTSMTVSMNDGPHMKMYQQHYWGSVEWTAEWNLRTFIEGWFGVAKNPTVAGMDRHFYRGKGTAHVSIAVLFAALVTNVHLLRNWHSQTGLGPADHPLLQADGDDHGFERLDANQAARIDRTHAIAQLAAAAREVA
jgi:hypothetical protein